MQQTIIFIHGLESSGSGTKGSFFRQRQPDMIIEDYFGSFEQRMVKLKEILQGKNNITFIGSSFGGLMSTVFTCLNQERVIKLILLAPALHLQHYDPYRNTKLQIPITIYHGLQDDVVPIKDVRETAKKLYLNHIFHAVKDDHSLHHTFPNLDWDALLRT